MVSRVRRVILILLFLALMMPGSLARAVEYGGLGGIPANPDPDNPRTKSIFVYTISPGQVQQDAINVVNNTPETKTVEIYATDSEIASGGSFACRQKVDQPVSVGTWVQLSINEVKLAPNSSQVVPFSVTVPDPVGVGEHNGCLVIQEKAVTSEQAGNGVQLSFRSALRVAITVPGNIVKEVEFTDLTVQPQTKKYVISAKLTNKGNVSLDGNVKVFVNNWLFGGHLYDNGGVYPLLAQKTPVELNFEFNRPYWGGFYRVGGYVEYNGDVDTPLGVVASNNVRKTAPTRLLFVPPQPPALALELLLLIILIVLIWSAIKRLGSRRLAKRTWKTYRVQKGDTLVTLSKARNVPWKTVAKINKLHAPYELVEGADIKLPVKPKTE